MKEHTPKYCACFECVIEAPIAKQEPMHREVGPCPCSACIELQRKQEAAWDERMRRHIETKRLIASIHENSILSKEQLNALEEQYHGNSLIQLLVNNARYLRSIAQPRNLS
jgi:hypothetical protein